MTASFEAATPALQEVQRLSPNDPRNGSNIRALTALRESWVNDSRDWRFPGEAPSRRQQSAVRRRRAAQQPRKTEGCPPVARIYPLGPLRRPQASSNTYPNGLTPRQQTAALQRLCTTFDEGKSSMRRKRIKRHNGEAGKGRRAGSGPVTRELGGGARTDRGAWMHCRSPPLRHPAKESADARLERRRSKGVGISCRGERAAPA